MPRDKSVKEVTVMITATCEASYEPVAVIFYDGKANRVCLRWVQDTTTDTLTNLKDMLDTLSDELARNGF